MCLSHNRNLTTYKTTSPSPGPHHRCHTSGIKLPSNPTHHYQANYIPILTHLSSLLDTWWPLCVSLRRSRCRYFLNSFIFTESSWSRSPLTFTISFNPGYSNTYGAPQNLECQGLFNFVTNLVEAWGSQTSLVIIMQPSWPRSPKTEIPLWVSLEAIYLYPLMGPITNPTNQHSGTDCKVLLII